MSINHNQCLLLPKCVSANRKIPPALSLFSEAKDGAVMALRSEAAAIRVQIKKGYCLLLSWAWARAGCGRTVSMCEINFAAFFFQQGKAVRKSNNSFLSLPAQAAEKKIRIIQPSVCVARIYCERSHELETSCS